MFLVFILICEIEIRLFFKVHIKFIHVLSKCVEYIFILNDVNFFELCNTKNDGDAWLTCGLHV